MAEHKFTVGNRVRGLKSNRVYTVVAADIPLCFAYLRNEEGKLSVVSWMWPSGVVDESILDNYEKVEENESERA